MERFVRCLVYYSRRQLVNNLCLCLLILFYLHLIKTRKQVVRTTLNQRYPVNSCFLISTPQATTVFVTKLAIGRQVSAILPGAVLVIRKQRGYLSDNVGSRVRWRTRLRFYGADKKLISERGSCLVVCLLGEIV